MGRRHQSSRGTARLSGYLNREALSSDHSRHYRQHSESDKAPAMSLERASCQPSEPSEKRPAFGTGRAVRGLRRR
jgi:hypothetical protein